MIAIYTYLMTYLILLSYIQQIIIFYLMMVMRPSVVMVSILRL